MRYLFFVNLTAGKGNIQDKIIKSINEWFSENGGEYRIHITKSRGDARDTARAEAETGDAIRMFACGGEGTSFEVLNGIVGYDNVSLGVIPCGSANDFLKFFGSKSPFLDISDQVNGNETYMDIIKADDCYCLNGCSVGMDAMVARDMSIFKRWPLVSGAAAYKFAVAKTFLRPLGVSVNISLDDAPAIPSKCLFAVVANAPFYGGGYDAAPAAVPNDGKLDFTMVDVIPKLRIPGFLKKYESGSHGELDYCRLENCSSMEFTSEKPIPVNLDGEIEEKTHMRFVIVRNGVKFILPKSLCGRKTVNA